MTRNSSASVAQKIAIVTGAASGIGLSTAQRLAVRGYHVLLWDKDGDKAVAAAKALPSAEGVPVDLGDTASVKAAAAAALTKHGSIDAVVASGGISGHGRPFAEVDEAFFDAMMNVHVRGHFFLLQALLPGLKEGASIVIMSSIYARIGVKSMPHYAAAKGALLALTKALATELGPKGIRVNAVTPGLIRTPMTEASSRGSDAFFSDREAILPLRRLTTTDEVAASICFLLSDDANGLTGQAISPSSGEVMAD